MPYNPDGSFTLTQDFGTGVAPDNQLPPKIGDSLGDIATSIDINNIFSQASIAGTVAATFQSLVVGSPTGGNLGAGSTNSQTIYENDQRVFAQTGTATGGIVITPHSFGTVSSGTIAPSPATCLKQNVTNNGAFTVLAPSVVGDVELVITNAASAGTVTFTGFSKQWSGDSMATTNGNAYAVFIYGFSSKTAYIVKALQ